MSVSVGASDVSRGKRRTVGRLRRAASFSGKFVPSQTAIASSLVRFPEFSARLRPHFPQSRQRGFYSLLHEEDIFLRVGMKSPSGNLMESVGVNGLPSTWKECSNDEGPGNWNASLGSSHGSGPYPRIREHGAAARGEPPSLRNASRAARQSGSRRSGSRNTAGCLAQLRPVQVRHKLQSLAVSDPYESPLQATAPSGEKSRSALGRGGIASVAAGKHQPERRDASRFCPALSRAPGSDVLGGCGGFRNSRNRKHAQNSNRHRDVAIESRAGPATGSARSCSAFP